MSKEHLLLSKFIAKSENIALQHGLSEDTANAVTALVTLAFAAGLRLVKPEESEAGDKRPALTLVKNNIVDIKDKE